MFTWIKKTGYVFAMSFCLLLIQASLVLAVTDIGSATIATDTVWTKEGSPYVVSNLTINTGVTLTVEAGTVVKLTSQGTVQVNGKLVLNGTSSSPVVFTSIKDDSFGGDTDGVDEIPKRGEGGNIIVGNNGEFICDYTKLLYGGINKDEQYYVLINNGNSKLTNTLIKDFYGNAIKNAGELIINHCDIIGQNVDGIENNNKLRIDNSRIEVERVGIISNKEAIVNNCKINSNYAWWSIGVEVTGEVIISDSQIFGKGTGIKSNGAKLELNGCTISSNQESISGNNGIGLLGYGEFKLKNNQFVANGVAIAFERYPNDVVIVEDSGNTYSNNKYDGYGLVSLSNTAAKIKPLTKPYIIIETLTVAKDTETEIEAGTIFKFMVAQSNTKCIKIEGKLILNGDSNNHVVFTSIKDDNYGGDTDGVDETPEAGDWGNIIVGTNGELICNNAKLLYGGFFSNSTWRTYLIGNNGKVQIKNSIIGDFYSTGIENNGILIIDQLAINGVNSSNGIINNKELVIKDSEIAVKSLGIKNQDKLEADNCNIIAQKNNQSIGIETTGNAIIKNSQITGSGISIKSDGAKLELINSIIISNKDSGTGLSGYGEFIIKNNHFTGNVYPMAFERYPNEAIITEYNGNKYTDNKYNAIRISSLPNTSAKIGPMDLSYIITNNLTVAEGSEVELVAGTVFKFITKNDNNKINLYINGKLAINGNNSNPVVFTSIKDDKYGGDTDGLNETPQAGDWGIIIIHSNGELNGSNFKILYGGQGIDSQSYKTYLIENNGKIELKDTIIKDFYHDGIINDGIIVIDRVEIVRNNGNNYHTTSYGIVTSKKLTITNSQIAGPDIGIAGSGEFNVKNNQFVKTAYPVAFAKYPNGVVLNEWSGNTYTDNRYNGIRIISLSDSSAKIKPFGLPYLIADNLTVAKDIEVEIEAGTVFKFIPINNQNYIERFSINVDGKLLLNGTSDNPVVITSVADDNYGGDTDVRDESPQRGDWGAIIIGSSGELVSNYGRLLYGGLRYINFQYSYQLIVNNGKVQLTNSILHNYSRYGIINSGELVIERCQIGGENSGYGVINNNEAVIKDSKIEVLNEGINSNGNIQIENCDIKVVNAYWSFGVSITGNAAIKKSQIYGDGFGIKVNGGKLQLLQCDISSKKDYGIGIQLLGGEARITSSTINNNFIGIDINGGQLDLLNSEISSNTTGILYQKSAVLPYIRNNNFMDNGIAVKNSNSTAIDCAWNYWNHEAGPSTYQSATKSWTNFGDRIEGAVTYIPLFNTKCSETIVPVQISITGITEGQKLNCEPEITVTITEGKLNKLLMNGEPWQNGNQLPDGEHCFKVVAENFVGEVREVEVRFTIDRVKPVAVIDNGLEIRAVAGKTIKFTANQSSDNTKITSYNWKFSDGTNHTSSTVTRTFANVGEYQVTLTVTDEHGNNSEPVTAKIVIEKPLAINIEGVSDGQKSNHDLTISVGVLDGTIQKIELNQVAITENPFVVTKEGNYTLKVTTKSDTDAENVRTITFSIDKTPPVAILGTSRTFYINEETVISGGLSIDNMGIAEYVWNIEGDPTEYKGMILRKVFTEAKEHNIYLRVRDNHGNWSQEAATLKIQVQYRPVEVNFIDILNINDGQKINQDVELKVTSKYGSIKNIKLNGENVENNTKVTVEGTHKVEVIAVNENNEERIFTLTFSIDKTPPTAFIDHSVIIQGWNDNREITFAAADTCSDNTGIVEYEWSFSDGQIYKGQTISRGFSQAGEYVVSLVTIDGYGNRSLPDTKNFTIKEKGNIQIQFSGVVDQGRYNKPQTVTVNVLNGTLLRVWNNNQLVNTNTITISKDGIYDIKVEAQNEQGYIAIDTLRIFLDTTPPVADAGKDLVCTVGSELILTGRGTDKNGIAEYKWVFSGDNQEYFGQTYKISDLSYGEYTAKLWVKDTYGNWSVEPAVIKIKVEHRPVELEISGVYHGMYTNKDVIIEAKATHGNIKSVKLNGSPYQFGSVITEEGRYTLTLELLNEGQVSSEQKIIFTIDKTKPVANAGQDQKCFNDDEKVPFNGYYSSDNVGIGKMEWTFSDTGQKMYGPLVYKRFDTPGIYTVTLVVTDMAGNVSEPDTCQIEVIDKGKTKILINGFEHRQKYNQDVLFNIEVEEGFIQKVLVDGKEFKGNSGKIDTDGYHEIYVEASNQNGYVLRKVQGFFLDKTPPVPDAGGNRRIFTGQTVKLDGSFSSDTNEIIEYQWEFSDGEVVKGKKIERSYGQPGIYFVDLWVVDNFGNRSTKSDRIEIEVKDPGEFSIINIKVKNDKNQSLPSSTVVFEDEHGESIKLVTDFNGELSELLDLGTYRIYVFAPGYKSLVKELVVTTKTVFNEEYTLEVGSDIVAKAESRQLDLNEIKELGIDTNDPENRFVYEFGINLYYKEEHQQSEPIKLVVTPKKVVYEYKPEKIPGGTTVEYRHVPETSIVVFLIKGTASVLKEFHELSVIVANGADASVTLDSTMLKLNLPEGLSLAPIPEQYQTYSGYSILKQSTQVDAGTIRGQEQKKISWVLRGDKAGTYSPTIEYSGILNPFEVTINGTTTLNDPIKISDPSRLVLRTIYPERIYKDENFVVTVQLENKSDITYYEAYLQIDEINVGANLELVSKPEMVKQDYLPAGSVIKVDVVFRSLITGIFDFGYIRRVGGNVSFGCALAAVDDASPDAPEAARPKSSADGSFKGGVYYTNKSQLTIEWDQPADNASLYDNKWYGPSGIRDYLIYINGQPVDFDDDGKLDWVTKNSCTLPYLESGHYEIKIQARDHEYNVSSLGTGFILIVDKSAPTMPDPGPATPNQDGFTNNKELTWSWGAAQDDFGIRGYKIQIDTDGVIIATEILPADTRTFTSQAQDGKLNRCTVWAIDYAGNYGPEAIGTVKVGISVPQVSLPTSPVQFNHGSAIFKWLPISNNHYGAIKYEVAITETTAEPSSNQIVSTNDNQLSYQFNGLSVRNNYYFWVRGIDQLGNIGAWVRTDVMPGYDIVAPDSELLSGIRTHAYNVSGKNNGKDYRFRVFCQLQGSTNAPFISGNIQEGPITVSFPSDGIWEWWMEIVEFEDGKEIPETKQITESFILKIDTTSPTGTIKINNTSSVIEISELKADDNGLYNSGVKEVILWNGDERPKVIKTITIADLIAGLDEEALEAIAKHEVAIKILATGSSGISAQNILWRISGDSKVVMEIIDNAGNRTVVDSLSKPNILPQVLLPTVINTTPGQPVQLTASVYDADGTIVKYEWDLGDGNDCIYEGQPVIKYTKVGNYTLTLSVTDNDGGITTAATTVIVSNTTRGRLYMDETWSGTHYIYETVEVPSDVKLTILPGTTIIVDTAANAKQLNALIIKGNLVVQGASQNVKFTSIVAEQNSWGGIMIEGTATIEGAVVEQAVRGVIITPGATVDINGCIFQNCEVGIHVYGSTPSITNSTFQWLVYGIKEDENGRPTVIKCTFKDNEVDYYHEQFSRITIDCLNQIEGNKDNTN